MSEKVERELVLPAPRGEVWRAVTADGWLADEVKFDLRPGGDARFRSGEEVREGWVEEVLHERRLAFWWAHGDETASRVELLLDDHGDGATRLAVRETRPLELLDLVGIPLARPDGRAFGPALLAGR